MTSLRHRTDHNLLSSSDHKSSSSSSRAKLHRRSTGTSNRFFLIVACFLSFIVLLYVAVLSHIVNVPRPTSVEEPHQRGKTRGGGNRDGKKKRHRKAPKSLDGLSGQDLLRAQQEHVPKDLKDLIPELKMLKEKFPSVDRAKRTKKNIFKAYDKNNQVQLEQKRDKKGNVVYTPITSVKKGDLKSMGFPQEKIDALENISYDDAIEGRERLVQILNEAGISDIDPEAIAMLPKWSSIEKLYGDKPVVLGLERCEEFRTLFDPADASIGPAGMFNTGTNPLAMYISNNCRLPRNKRDKAGGTRWQVPWGKHMLNSHKWSNTAGHDHNVNKTNVMPIVVVRDPFTWMQSMCKSPYQARWPHSTCPNLAKRKLNSDGTPEKVPVKVKYSSDMILPFDSLAHYWAQWYKEYLEADYPRLIVRFEDIQFHGKELIETICQCAGAVPRNDDALFRYVVDTAKWGAAHTKCNTNMISAMVKYGSDEKRFTGMTEADWLVAKEVFTPELMDLLGYEIPEKLKEMI